MTVTQTLGEGATVFHISKIRGEAAHHNHEPANLNPEPFFPNNSQPTTTNKKEHLS